MKYISTTIFIVLTIAYYNFYFGDIESSQIFLTTSSFLFAIFAGFFISRQGNRYSQIRDHITTFDGGMSSIYRHAGHLGIQFQQKIKKIITDHYTKILKYNQWDYHINHKSNTLTSIHQTCEKYTKGKSLKSLPHHALQGILMSLEKSQICRKNMVALYQERIPKFQWMIIYFLAIILLITLSLISSETDMMASLLKSAFATLIISVLVLLHKFDQLSFFEKTIGEKSAQDVLDIFAGKK